MYKEHPVFIPPEDNAVLWRYMDFTKFVSVLEESAMFFARADKLGDPFEGYLPDLNRAKARNFHEGYPKNVQMMFNAIKQKARFMLISCWHENDSESAAMWKLYSKDDNVIAIKTDFDSLANSFTCSQDIWIGSINYIDYKTGSFPRNNPYSPFLCKRKSFEHEHEVRAVVEMKGSEDGQEKVLDAPREICNSGEYFEVDLSCLIHEVIISPYAPGWLLELVRSVVARYDLNVPVIKSDLADNPTWD